MMSSDFEDDDFVYDDGEDSDFDMDDSFEVPVKKKKEAPARSAIKKKKVAPSRAKSSVATKKKTTKASAPSSPDVLDLDRSEENIDPIDQLPGVTKTKKGRRKSTSDKYVKLQQIEHILLRPDTYVGSINHVTEKIWVFDEETCVTDDFGGETKEGGMTFREVTYVPGLYKIFDEILVNAADNAVRDSNQTMIKVTIDKENNRITVRNDGRGIPIEKHSKENVWIPELVFGHLLTSSNYDDNEKKTTGGRNGFGAKLTNIFSKEFTIETVSVDSKKKYTQTWNENMGIKNPPRVVSCKAKAEYTEVSFVPDLERFKLSELDTDTVALLTKRVYDIAGCNRNLKVYLNGESLQIRSFEKYVNLYFAKSDNKVLKTYEKVNDRWEICFAPSDGEFQQVSFVNSISTIKGGSHVEHVAARLVKQLKAVIEKKNAKGAKVKPNQIKQHMFLFVNALIENPAFTSQTKEALTTSQKDFGSNCNNISDDFYKKVARSGVVKLVLEFSKFKEQGQLKRVGGVKKNRIVVPKLDDANDAGVGKKAQHCTLILTEGDSAKALAVSGISVVGRDRYGVFPLRGKLLNVREASHTQIMNNAEITYLKQILGLQHNVTYHDVSKLRYGHVMIMTDQDHDGSHIKGLVINFIHHFWPSLLEIPGFLQEFVTPIVKARKGKRERPFFTLPEFTTWKEQNNNGKGWNIKYYKGLGTSTAKEAKEYFSHLVDHKIEFLYDKGRDGQLIDLVFNKKRADNRKEWLRTFDPKSFVDHSEDTLRYDDFIHKEMIHFSNADNARSIPSMVDGLKPGQRKILFACFKRNLKGEIKVAQLSGYVAEHSAYHHGETSLSGTIVNMAQDYVGANNINLLLPIGQFGTRLAGGKDSASARYVFTSLSQVTRTLFNEKDDALLSYLDDDGASIEPEWYMPVIPLVLVNGSDGIGTGWSSSVPNYNPRDVVSNVRRLLKGEEQVPLHPWYKGFTGEIIPKYSSSGSIDNYTVRGSWNITSDDTLVITELPLKTWTTSYKDFLDELLKAEYITDIKQHHTDTTVNFVVTMPEATLSKLEADPAALEKKFKLSVTKLSINNMHLFDAKGRMKKYTSPEEIVEEFYDLRLEHYRMRKDHILETLTGEHEMLENKVRFITAVVENKLEIRNKKKAILVQELSDKGYKVILSKAQQKKQAAASLPGAPEEADDDDDAASPAKGYEYLLGMSLWSLTREKVEALQKQLEEKEAELDELLSTSVKELWLKDIDEFELVLEQAEKASVAASTPKSKKGAPSRRRGAKLAARRADDDDDEFVPEGVSRRLAPAPVKKRAVSSQRSAASAARAKTKKYANVEEIDSDDDDDNDNDDDDDRSAKRKKTVASSAKAAPKKVAPAPESLVSRHAALFDLIDSEEEDSLAARLAQRTGFSQDISPAKKKKGRKLAPAASSKPKQPSFYEDSDGSSDDSVEIVSKTTTKKRPAPSAAASRKKKQAVEVEKEVSNDDESEDEDEDDEDEDDYSFEKEMSRTAKKPPAKKKAAPAKKKAAPKKKAAAPAPKKAAPKKAAPAPTKKKQRVIDLDDDSDDESNDQSDDDEPVVVVSKRAAPRGRRGATTKKPVYFTQSSDEEEDAGDDDSADDGDVSMFDEGNDSEYSEDEL